MDWRRQEPCIKKHAIDKFLHEYSVSNASNLFYKHGITWIPALISNYTHCDVWDEITFAFANFNGGIVEVWE